MGGFGKINIFWGMRDLVDIWGRGSSQNWTIFRGHFYAFKAVSFLKVNVENEGIFGVAKISNIFWGA